MAVNIITPRRREDFFKPNGDPTNRFIDWIELVTGQTNNSSTTIVENTDLINGFSILPSPFAQIKFLQMQLDGLPEFTMDTEGFTMDTTDFTMDKAIA